MILSYQFITRRTMTNINNDSLFSYVYNVDTWWALLKAKIDEKNKTLVLIQRHEKLTKEDKENIFKAWAFLEAIVSSSNIDYDDWNKLITDSKNEYTYEDWTIEYVMENPLHNSYYTKIFIVKGDDVQNYREHEILLEEKNSIDRVENLTVSVNWYCEENWKKIENIIIS